MPTIPVFVSSTFRDFHGERDALRRYVAPALDAVVAPYGAQVELLDLRWGVDTSSAASEQDAQQKVLEVCLAEVERCEPLFVGLIGDRYGWIPSPERLAAAVGAAHVGTHAVPSETLSVTALEVWYGLSQRNCEGVVALRSLVGTASPAWVEAEHPAGIRWLRRFSRDLAENGEGRIHLLEYSVCLEDDRPEPSDMELFAQQMLGLLTPLVMQRARTIAHDADPYRSAVQILEESRREVFVGRSDFVESTLAQVAGPGFGVTLTGPPGIGKTAALLACRDRLSKTGYRVASAYVGVGGGTTETDWVIAELADQLGLEVPAGGGQQRISGDALRAWWGGQMNALTQQTVILIDGLDRLDPGAAFVDLPMIVVPPLQSRLRYLVTTSSQTQRDVCSMRGVPAVPLDPLAPEDAAATAVAAAYHRGRRELPVPVVEALGAKARSPIWITLAVNELTWLRREDFIRAESSVDDPAAALVRLLADSSESMPERDEDLAERLLQRTAELFPDLTMGWRFLATLALSPSGLAEGDLQRLTGATPLTVSRARWMLGASLLQRDTSGRLGFVDQLLIGAILNRISPETRAGIHGLIADHLRQGQLNDPIVGNDLVWHASLSGRTDLLATALESLTKRGALAPSSAADTLARAVVASRGQPTTATETIHSLPATISPAAREQGAVVLTGVLQRHGRHTLRFPEAAAFVDTLLRFLDSAERAGAPQDPAATSAALVVAGRVLADGRDTSSRALELLVSASRYADLIPNTGDRERHILNAELALAESQSAATRAVDFARAAAEVFAESMPDRIRKYQRTSVRGQVLASSGLTFHHVEARARHLAAASATDMEAQKLLVRALLVIARSSYENILPKAAEAELRARTLRDSDPADPELRALQVEALLTLVRCRRMAAENAVDTRAMCDEVLQSADALALEFPSRPDIAVLRLDVHLDVDSTPWASYEALFQRFQSAAPDHSLAEAWLGQDPQRKSLQRMMQLATSAYEQELVDCERPWAAAGLHRRSDRALKAAGHPGASRIPGPGPYRRLFRRVVLFPSLRSLFARLLELVTLMFWPKETFVTGRGPYSEWVSRSRRTRRPEVEYESVLAAAGTSSVSSMRRRLARILVLQTAATAAVLIPGLGLVLAASRGEQWLLATAISLPLAWQQASRSAGRWGSVPALGTPTEAAERARARLIEELQDTQLQASALGSSLGVDFERCRGRVLWRSERDTTSVDRLIVDRASGLLISHRRSGRLECLSTNSGEAINVASEGSRRGGPELMGAECALGGLVVTINDPDFPNGGNIAARVTVRSAMSGVSEASWSANGMSSRAVAISPDGHTVATATSRTITVWSLKESPRPVARLEGHTGDVLECRFHPDGRRLATASTDGTIVLWDVPNGTSLTVLRPGRRTGYRHWVSECAFSPNGRFVMGHADGRVHIWDLENGGELLHVFRANDGSGIAVDRSGTLLALPGNKSVVVWDLNTMAEVARAVFSDDVTAIHWHPSADVLYVGVALRVYAVAFE